MAYDVERVAKNLKDYFNFTEEEATKAIVDSGVADENGKLTQKALHEGWGTMEHGKEKITEVGQQLIGETARKTMAKLD